MSTLINKTLIIFAFILLSFTGCVKETTFPSFPTYTAVEEKQSLNETIIDIADQLKRSNKLKLKDTGTIAITTFVDLNKFDKTTHFGRILGESMFNELFVRGFNVSDFRGQGAISINNKGEFYITRDISKLASEVNNTYILVGTYSKIENKTLLNVRIMDNTTGKIVASARAIHKHDYCSIKDEICIEKPKVVKRKIKIITDEQSNLI